MLGGNHETGMEQIYEWAHTDLGDGICSAALLLAAMVVILAGSWVTWFLGF